MIWQTRLAAPAQNLVTGLVDGLGRAFGLGSTSYNSGTGPIIQDVPTEVNGVPVAHTGWQVGRAAAPAYRTVPANDSWSDAPRLHSGTGNKTVGEYLKAGERKAVILDTERVVTEQQWNDRAGPVVAMGGQAPIVNILPINNTSVPMRVREGAMTPNGDGSFNKEVIFEEFDSWQADRQMNGQSRMGHAVEQSYALERKVR
jgi:hypothetical protein